MSVLLQVSPDIMRWSGFTELMRLTGEARIKYLSSQTRPHDVSEVSLGGEMLVLGVSRQSSSKDQLFSCINDGNK